MVIQVQQDCVAFDVVGGACLRVAISLEFHIPFSVHADVDLP